MIEIKLREILEDYNVNISDLSDATGLSRSTITPLVNNPEEVKGINLDTIDIICDFFGINIEELVSFTQSDKKYTLEKYWTSDDDNYIFLFKKKLGKRYRYSFVTINIAGFSLRKDFQKGIILVSNSFFADKKKTIKLIDDLNLDIDKKDFPEKNIFENDFSKQSDKNMQTVTKLLASCMIGNIKTIFENPFDQEVKYIEFNWIFKSKKNIEKKEYIYDIEKKEIIAISKGDNDSLEMLNLMH